MLRITRLSQGTGEEVLKLEGWIVGEGVSLLAQAGAPVLQRGDRLVLELTGVRFLDEEGLCLLQRWSDEQLVLRGGTWFIRLLLARHGLATPKEGEELM